MRKILMICAALAFLTNGTPAFAQDAVVKKIIEIGKTDNQVMHQIDILTNRFGGRPIGACPPGSRPCASRCRISISSPPR